MKPTAIVYSSHTGHTARYAGMFAEESGLPFYSLAEADKKLARGTRVIYMGWLLASTVKDYGKARRRYEVMAVCGVGLCDTGTLLSEVRKAARIPSDIPLFTLQGGIDLVKLQGIYRKMINTLTRFMISKKNPTADDRRMVELLQCGEDFVSRENLAGVLKWYEEK